jgi:hypothetical protein
LVTAAIFMAIVPDANGDFLAEILELWSISLRFSF